MVPIPAPVDGPMVGPDRPMLEGYLAWQRWTFWNICAWLTADQLAGHPLATTNLSLLGLMRHLAKVERTWFRQRVPAGDMPPLFDPALGKDADFELGAAADAPAEFERWQEECRAGDEVAAAFDFDHVYSAGSYDLSLRMTYVHLIGEYARHNGHADLLRQAIDGSVGR
jgi:uncharacterized damage-inducible protein DinB